MRLLRATLLLALVLGASATLVPVAQAAPIFRYTVQLDDGAFGPAGGYVDVDRLDVSKSTRIIVSPPTGPNRYDSGTLAAGPDSFSTPTIANLAGGDTVIVRQPASSVAPTESFVIPSVQLNVTVGASVVTGTLPPGIVGAIQGEYRCDDEPVPHALATGAFSIPYTKILPGETVELNASTLDGDSLYAAWHAPGETPCVAVYARAGSPPVTGAPPNPTPYRIQVDNLRAYVAPSVRVVLRRGASILFDSSADAPSLASNIAAQALPGDVVDIYRPKTALTPMHSRTIPPVSAVFDPTVDLAAVDAPAASQIEVGPCRAYSCPMENIRSRLNSPAGRSFFDFKLAESYYPPVDLRPDDRLGVTYDDPDRLLSYTFQAVVGDLVAPTQSIKLPNKIKLASLLKALKKGYKVKLNSSEPGTAKLALTLPAATTSAKKKSKPVTLATAVKTVKAGTNSITLKFTKSGKKALKKLSKKHSRSVVLSSTVTDASGNASTIAKTAKIKP